MTEASNNITEREYVRSVLQQQYDLHYQKYKKGCKGCIVAMWAVRDVARALEIPIKEVPNK